MTMTRFYGHDVDGKPALADPMMAHVFEYGRRFVRWGEGADDQGDADVAFPADGIHPDVMLEWERTDDEEEYVYRVTLRGIEIGRATHYAESGHWALVYREGVKGMDPSGYGVVKAASAYDLCEAIAAAWGL